MAATGYTPILIYASGTTGNTPLAANLTSSSSGAELALNFFDGKLFYKDSSGTVQVLATKAGAFGDVVGPASATANALARFDTTTGKLVKNSVGILSDAGVLTGLTGLTSSGNVTLSSLTATRLPYASTGGLLVDSANLTFNGTNLTVGGTVQANAFVGPNDITSYMNLAQNTGLVVRGGAGSPANQVELWIGGGSKALLASNGRFAVGSPAFIAGLLSANTTASSSVSQYFTTIDSPTSLSTGNLASGLRLGLGNVSADIRSVYYGTTTDTGISISVSNGNVGTLRAFDIDSNGNLIQSAPTTPPSLTANGQMVFNLTSNTNLRVSVRGSDGVTRTANITLS